MKIDPSIITNYTTLLPEEKNRLESLIKGDRVIFGISGVFLCIVIASQWGDLVDTLIGSSFIVLFQIYWLTIAVRHRKEIKHGQVLAVQTYIADKVIRRGKHGKRYFFVLHGIAKKKRVPRQLFEEASIGTQYALRIGTISKTIFSFERIS